MPYKIIDKQIHGREFADGAIFKNKDEVRRQLVSFHETDMEESDKLILEKMHLAELLEFGEWSIEKV